MREDREGITDIAGFVDVLIRHIWWFVLPVLVGMVVVVSVGMRLPSKYKGGAVVDLKTNAVLTKMMRESLVPDYEVRKDSISDSVISEAALDRVMADLQVNLPEIDPTGKIDLNALRDNLKHKVIVTHRMIDSNHDRIEINLTHENPQLVRQVVNLLAQSFIDDARMEIDDEIKRSQTFFEDELATSRIAFENLDNERLAFEEKHADVLNVNSPTLQGMIASTVERSKSQDSRLRAALHRVQELQAGLATTPDTITIKTDLNDPKLTAVDDDLRSLRNLLAKSLGELQMREKHPDVVALRRAIAAAEAAREAILVSLKTETLVPNAEKPRLAAALAEAIAHWNALKDEEPKFDGQIEDLNRRIAAIVPLRTEQRDLAGKVEAARRQMEFWEENDRRTRLMMVTEYANAGIQLELSRPCPAVLAPMTTGMLPLFAAAMIISTLLGALGLRVGMVISSRAEARALAAFEAEKPHEAQPVEAPAESPEQAPPVPPAPPVHRWRPVAASVAAAIGVCLLATLWMLYSGRIPASADAKTRKPPGQVEPATTPETPETPGAPSVPNAPAAPGASETPDATGTTDEANDLSTLPETKVDVPGATDADATKD
ncbi:MAG: hypothetical protein WD768_19240 [Phycisphaeraceae bacterium]